MYVTLGAVDEFVRKFRSIGGTVTGERVLESESGGYTEVLQGLRDLDTEMLYLPVNAKEVIRILEAVDEIGWSPVMMGGDGLLASALTQYPDDAGILEGMYATDFFDDEMPMTSYGRKVRRAYWSLFDNEGTTYTLLGMEGYRVLYEAMNRCEDAGDRECINLMIRSTRNLEGVAGRLSINHEGKATRPLVVNAIRDGYMKFIIKVY